MSEEAVKAVQERGVTPRARERWAARAETFAWLTVLAFAALVPAVSTNPTILGIGTMPLTVDQIELPKAVVMTVLASLGLAAWGAAQWLRPGTVRVRHERWLLVGFLALAAVSALTSAYPEIVYVGRWFHYEGLLQFAVYAVVYFLALQTANTKRVIWFVRLGMCTGAVLAGYGLLQAFGLDPANWLALSWPGGRAFATWNNPDFFGSYLLFPLAFSMAVTASDADRPWRVAGVLSLALTSFALVMTLTRGAWLAGMLAAALLLVGLGRTGTSWRKIAVVGFVAFTVVIAAGYVATDAKLLTRALNTFKAGDDGVGGRLGIWEDTLPHVLVAPVLGTGPNTYAVTMARVYGARGVEIPDDPHNIVMYLLITLGIPATVLYLGFIGSTLVRSFRAIPADGPKDAGMALLALWSASVAYGFHLMLTVSIGASVALLFACLGILAAVGAPRVPVRVAGAAAAGVLGTLAVVVALYAGGRALAADHAYLNARSAPRDSAERVTWAERAVELNPLNDRYAVELTNARARQ